VLTPSGQLAARSTQDDGEFRRNYASAEYTNALYALDNGWDGTGVKVGVLDNGVKAIAELEGQISPLSRSFGGVRENGTLTAHASLGDDNSNHGTMVASVIAARNDGQGVQGFAPGASIVILRTDVMDNGQQTVGYGGDAAIRYAGDNGVLLVNRSLAKTSPDIADVAMQRAVRDYMRKGGLVINAAGNSGAANPANAIDMTADNREGWLFVTAIDPTGQGYSLASYANACGIAMDRCVAGVGTNYASNIRGETVAFSGTSSATPQVTALAATILSKWPQLNGVQAGQIILNTARDIGEAGVDAVFGHGLVDFQAALSPVSPTLSNGAVATAATGSTMIVPAALGGGSGDELASIENALASVTVLDSYGRDFDGDLSSLVVRTADAEGGALQHELERRANAGYGAFAAGRVSGSFGYTSVRYGPEEEDLDSRLTDASFALGLADGKTTLLAGFSGQDGFGAASMAPSADALIAYYPAADTSLGIDRALGRGNRLSLSIVNGNAEDGAGTGALLRWTSRPLTVAFGLVDEQGSVFGTPTGQGALRLADGAQTAFLEFSHAAPAGDWTLNGYAGLGATRLKLGADMLLTDADTLVTTRFGLGASRMVGTARVSFGLAQPLVSLAGKGTLTLGSGYDLASRSLTYDNRQVDLSGRMMPQVSFGLEKVAGRSSLRLSTSADADGTRLRAVAGWRVRFGG